MIFPFISGCLAITTESSLHREYGDRLSQPVKVKNILVRVYEFENYKFEGFFRKKPYHLRISSNDYLYQNVLVALKENLGDITVVQPFDSKKQEFDQMSEETLDKFINETFPANIKNHRVIDIVKHSDIPPSDDYRILLGMAMGVLHLASLGFIPMWTPMEADARVTVYESNMVKSNQDTVSNKASGWMWTPFIFRKDSHSFLSIREKRRNHTMPFDILEQQMIKVAVSKKLNQKQK